MSQRVSELPPANAGRKAIYPWDEWLDGSVWLLKQGEDFQTSVNAFRATAHVAGKRRGVKVATRKRDEGLYIQAFESDGLEAP